MATLILIRGLPGSGKSTMAKALSVAGFKHYEADMYHMQDGEYRYEPLRAKNAHQWCLSVTRFSLAKGGDVVVSNTFTTRQEMEPYQTLAESLGVRLVVLTAKGNWQNIHGVPEEVLGRMRSRWEDI